MFSHIFYSYSLNSYISTTNLLSHINNNVIKISFFFASLIMLISTVQYRLLHLNYKIHFPFFMVSYSKISTFSTLLPEIWHFQTMSALNPEAYGSTLYSWCDGLHAFFPHIQVQKPFKYLPNYNNRNGLVWLLLVDVYNICY